MSLSKQLSISIKKTAYLFTAVFIGIVLTGGIASASQIGVGISTGRIDLKEKLKPGITYSLPKIAVFNNGDVTSDYEMSVQFNEKQAEMKPTASWISFSPQHFNLKAGKAQQITMKLRAGSGARPGKYFAYIEARPIKKDKAGKTAINIAAATKFSFTVRPANIFQKFFFFLEDLWNRYKRLLIPALIIVVSAAVITYSRRNLSVQVHKKPAMTKKSAKSKKSTSSKSEDS